MRRLTVIVILSMTGVGSPSEPAPPDDLPIHRALVQANDLLKQAVERRLRGEDDPAAVRFGEAHRLARMLESRGFTFTTRRIESIERWSGSQDRLAVETWRRLRRAEVDPVLASPEDLTPIIDACRDLGDRWCEARALLVRAECLEQSFPVVAVAEDAAAAEALLRQAGPGAALGRALLLMGGPGTPPPEGTRTKRQHHEEALELAQMTGDRSLEGRVRCGLAYLDLIAGHPETARQSLEQAQGLAARENLPRVAGCRAYVEGLGLFLQGQQAEARAVWDNFADSEMAKRAPRESLWALIGGTVASFSALSDPEGAVTRGGRARELADRLPGLTDRARTYTNLAIALSTIGKHREAGEVARIGLDLSRQAGLQAGEAICLTQLGTAAHQLGDPKGALRLCRESLELVTRDADRFYALVCIGSALQAEGRLESALARVDEARSLADRLGDARLRAHARNILSMIDLERGDPGRAEEVAHDALGLLGPEGNALTRAWALKTRGMARSVMQQHTLSVADLQKSFRLFESLGNLTAQARVAIDLGNVWYYLNRLDRALDYYEQAVALARQAGAVEARHIALGNLALSKRRFGRISESRRLLLAQAEEIDTLDSGALSANALLNLAEALDEIGEVPAAERLANRALGITVVHESAMLLARTHRVLASARAGQGRHDEAIVHCRTALDLSGSIGPWTAMDVHWTCGNVFLSGGLGAEGKEALLTALRVGETARAALAQPAFRASFLSDRTDLYVDLVRAVLRLAGPSPSPEAVEEALEVSERFRAWTLLEALVTGRRSMAGEDAREPAGPESRSELLARMAEIHLEVMGATSERRAEILPELRRIEDRLAAVTRSAREPAGHAILGGSRLSTSELPAGLPDGETAFLEYLTGSHAAYVFAVTRDGIQVAELPRSREEIQDDVRRFRGLIQRRGPDPERDRLAIRTLGERLYRTLISPAEGMLDPTIRRLVICPDGALHQLPYEALVAPGGQPDGPIRYLVEDVQIVMVPSLGVFTQLRREGPPHREAPPLVAFANPLTLPDGDPDAGDDLVARESTVPTGYPPLPYSEEEVRIAARRLGGEACIYSGSRATEEQARRVLAGGHQVVHFAGHGFLDAGSIGRSGLVLTPDPETGDDGLLQAREVVDLDISADLVILSGCSTSGGRLLPGEGPMGLPHAFFQAGASSILMSLWDVRDRAAAVFMDRFYAGLADGRSYGEALRAAKLDLIASGREELRHPSVWAPFVMAGLSDRYLDPPARGNLRMPGLTTWILGFLLLAVVLWVLSVLARRRSRSAPSRSSR